MVKRGICVYQVPDLDGTTLPSSPVGRCETRDELLNAIVATDVGLVILDLDADQSLNTVINLLEVRPDLGIVGVTGTANLNHVIAAQRAGCKQIVTRPIDPADLQLACRRAMNEFGDDAGRSKAVALMSATGGAGATLIACHLAAELASLGQARCALIDLDLEFGGIARSFDIHPQYSVFDLASAGAVDPSMLERTAVRMPLGVDVIARPPSIREAHQVEDQAVRSLLRLAARTYPYVVIDLPRTLDEISGAAIESCDKLIIVIQLTVPNVDNARRLITALADEGVSHDRIGVVVNRYRKNVHGFPLEMAEKELGQRVLGLVPSDYASVNTALDTGKPLAAKNPVRTAISEIASRLIGAPSQPESRGWLANLVRGKRVAEPAR